MTDTLVAGVAFLLIAVVARPVDDFTEGLRYGMGVAAGALILTSGLRLIIGGGW